MLTFLEWRQWINMWFSSPMLWICFVQTSIWKGRTDSVRRLCCVKITELGKWKATTRGKVDDSGLKADIFSQLACYLKCDTICPSLSPPPWPSLGQAPGAAAFPLTLWPGSNREWGAGLDARGQWLWSSHVPQSCKVRTSSWKTFKSLQNSEV